MSDGFWRRLFVVAAHLRKQGILAILVVAGPTLSGTPAMAWERDVHYGLTQWLALKAGFPASLAKDLALATQAADEGILLPAPSVIPFYTCINHDPGASHFVQKYHFPSYAVVPAEPKQRTVSPGTTNNGATAWTQRTIPVIDHEDRAESLGEFGMSLHPLEDSWSHQGVPGIPPFCDRQLAWAHPDDRGGWWRHDADLTYLHDDDALATAKRVYDFLRQYLQARPDLSLHVGPPWQNADLEGIVRDFAKARTKEAKRAWFTSNLPTVPPDTFNDISLPESDNRLRSLLEKAPEAVPGIAPIVGACGTPQSPTELLQLFLDQWIVKRDLERALDCIDLPLTLYGWRFDRTAWTAEHRGAVVEAYLRMLLWRDHGIVNALGHVITPRALVVYMSIAFSDFKIFPRDLSDALIPYSDGTLYQLADGPQVGEEYYTRGYSPQRGTEEEVEIPRGHVVHALLRFKHAPYDSVMLVIAREGRKWAVIGIQTIPM